MSVDNGIQAAFDEIMDQYGNMIAKVCYIYGSDNESRKDMYQECLANIWQGLPKFRGDARVSSWIYRACINTCISYHRRERRFKDHLPISDLGEDHLSALEDNKESQLRELYALINRLQALDKAIIMMWLDEKSYDEIAAVTGLLRNTVATRLRRIKLQLQNLSNQ